jgi:ribosomal protein S18 acetylase RimI-like enzyme
MTLEPSIRKFLASEWRQYRELRLRALADSPDAFGSTYAAEAARDDAAWMERLAWGVHSDDNHPVVAEVQTNFVGLAWGRIQHPDDDAAHLFQMWVDPAHRRFGIGEKLLHAVIEWSKTRGVRHLVLGVTIANSAAMRLYLRAGFQPVGAAQELRPGSSVPSQEMRLGLRDE